MTKFTTIVLSALVACGAVSVSAQTGGGAAGGSPNGGPPPNTNSSAAGSVNGYKDSPPSAGSNKADAKTAPPMQPKNADSSPNASGDSMTSGAPTAKDPRIKDPNSTDGLPARAAGTKAGTDAK